MIRNLSIAVCAMALALPSLAAAQSGPLVLSNADRAFDFDWAPARFGDREEPHAAMLIPVRIEGCGKALFMQFDLGAPSTVLLRNMAEGLAAQTSALTIQPDGAVPSLTFTMGEVLAVAGPVRLVDTGSEATVACDQPDRRDIIGTIGADLLKDRVLVIDFPRERIFVGSEAPAAQAGLAMKPLMLTRAGVILTGVVIDNQTKNIMLDTGSSAFSLLTSQADWTAKARPGAAETTFPVNSWGRTLTAHTTATDSVVRFGEVEIPLGEVSYMEGVSDAQVRAMEASGMAGMTGNKLFVDRVLVLDGVGGTYGVGVSID